jgi:hypothetical protein
MNTRYGKILILAVLLSVLAWAGASVTQASPMRATQRPIQDFIEVQGTTSVFVPPVPDQLGWTTASTNPEPKFALFDYAGKANEYLISQGVDALGTTMSGKVTERPLPDGMARVKVILHTKQALAWAMPIDGSPDFANDPLAFGFRAQDIAADPTIVPALGDSHLKVVFINTSPGAPLPDLVACLAGTGPCTDGFEFISIKFHGQATGALHELAGLGPEGTPGRLIVDQIGNGKTPDGFPVERVELKRIGK